MHVNEKLARFPLFFTIDNFKEALLGDTKLWSSRHCRRRRCSHCHRSRPIVEKKEKQYKRQSGSHGKQMMNKMLSRGELLFVVVKDLHHRLRGVKLLSR